MSRPEHLAPTLSAHIIAEIKGQKLKKGKIPENIVLSVDLQTTRQKELITSIQASSFARYFSDLKSEKSKDKKKVGEVFRFEIGKPPNKNRKKEKNKL